MRKISLFLGAISALLAFSSCQKDEYQINSGSLVEGKQTIVASIDQSTKVSFTPDAEAGLKLAWEGDESITIYKIDGSTSQKWDDYTIQSIESDGDAIFYGKVLEEGVSYVAVYPKSDALSLDGRNNSVDLAATQVGDSYDHLDNLCRMKYGFTYSSTSSIAFAHELALLLVEHSAAVNPVSIEAIFGEGDDAQSFSVNVAPADGSDEIIGQIRLFVAPKLADVPVCITAVTSDRVYYDFKKDKTATDFKAGSSYVAPIGDFTTLEGTVNEDREIGIIKSRAALSLVGKDEVTLFMRSKYDEFSANGMTSIADAISNYGSVDNSKVAAIWESMTSDYNWANIDYTNKQASSWPVAEHLTNLRSMAIAYCDELSPYYNNSELFDDIMGGIQYWADGLFQSTNWYSYRIAVPSVMADIMLLVGDKLPESAKSGVATVLNKAQFLDNSTGSNKILIATNIFKRGVFYNDPEDIKIGIDSIVSELVIVEAGTEGFQNDYSYQLHGPQMQIGNYGYSAVSNMTYWFNILKNTTYQVSDDKISIVRNFLLNCANPAIWHGEMDIHGLGRQIFSNTQVSKALSMSVVMLEMMAADPAYQGDYQAYFDRNYKSVHNNNLVGNFYFDDSKYMVHRGEDFYFSLRMVSNKVYAGECVNSENLNGYYLGDGATFTCYKGGEYTNINSFWNSFRIPGITVKSATDDTPNWYDNVKYIQSCDFVGGLTNGTQGIAAMEFCRDKISSANKGYFMLKDKMVCLGNNITNSQTTQSSKTILEQNRFRGQLTYLQGTSTTTGGIGTSVSTPTFISDGVGYKSLDGANIDLSVSTLQGNWLNVADFLGDASTSGDVLLAQFSHPTDVSPYISSYQYVVEPGADPETFFADNENFKVVSNTSTVSAVECEEEKIGMYIFWQAGKFVSEIYGTITSQQPLIIMIEGSPENFTSRWSNPTGTEHTYTISGPPADQSLDATIGGAIVK